MNIETDRLIIRNYTLQDAPFLYKFMNSEGWLKNIGNRNINTILEAERYLLKNYLGSYEKQGFGPYIVSFFEAASAIMNYASEELGLKKVLAFTIPENASSIKLLKKLVLSEIETYSYGDEQELLLFSN